MNSSDLQETGLTPSQWQTVTGLIEKELVEGPSLDVFLFGSRAVGRHRKYSDVDLLLVPTQGVLSQSQLDRIRTALEDSELPFKFDVVADSELEASYRQKIRQTQKLVARLP